MYTSKASSSYGLRTPQNRFSRIRLQVSGMREASILRTKEIKRYLLSKELFEEIRIIFLQTTSSPPFFLRDSRASETRVRAKITPREKGETPFLAWGDFHAPFARSTIPEDKWGTTRSLSFSVTSFMHIRGLVTFKLRTTNCGLRLKVSRYLSTHIWDLRFADGSSRRPWGIVLA